MVKRQSKEKTKKDTKKQIKCTIKKKSYKCEKCGYISSKVFFFDPQIDTRFCIKCATEFFNNSLPKVKLIEEK